MVGVWCIVVGIVSKILPNEKVKKPATISLPDHEMLKLNCRNLKTSKSSPFISAFDELVFRTKCLLERDILAYGKMSEREVKREISRVLGCSYRTAQAIIEDLVQQGVLGWVDYGFLTCKNLRRGQ